MTEPQTKKAIIPTSARTAKLYFVDGESDPLHFLFPWEQQAAELYVSLALDPTGMNSFGGNRARRNVYQEQFEAEFGIPLTMSRRTQLHGNPAWRAYVQQLKDDARGQALKKLKNKASRAVETYLWAQDTARGSGDYKEARVAAGDHLDRIGATEKPSVQPVQAIQIVVKSRNVDLANPFKELPAVEVVESFPEGTNPKDSGGGT